MRCKDRQHKCKWFREEEYKAPKDSNAITVQPKPKRGRPRKTHLI